MSNDTAKWINWIVYLAANWTIAFLIKPSLMISIIIVVLTAAINLTGYIRGRTEA
jgi:hypothetical protein